MKKGISRIREILMNEVDCKFTVKGITEYGMIVKDEKGFPHILSDFKYFNEFRENYSEKKQVKS